MAVKHGDVLKNPRSRNRGIVSSMAVAPSKSSEAAGVTESGKFSQSDEELASRGLSCHYTLDDLDLDKLNSLFSKVMHTLTSSLPHPPNCTCIKLYASSVTLMRLIA